VNYKVSILLLLAIFSFINNLFLHFDQLKHIHQEETVEVFYMKVEPDVEMDHPIGSYIKTIYDYTLYFIFFFNIHDIRSIITVQNYA